MSQINLLNPKLIWATYWFVGVVFSPQILRENHLEKSKFSEFPKRKDGRSLEKSRVYALNVAILEPSNPLSHQSSCRAKLTLRSALLIEHASFHPKAVDETISKLELRIRETVHTLGSKPQLF